MSFYFVGQGSNTGAYYEITTSNLGYGAVGLSNIGVAPFVSRFGIYMNEAQGGGGKELNYLWGDNNKFKLNFAYSNLTKTINLQYNNSNLIVSPCNWPASLAYGLQSKVVVKYKPTGSNTTIKVLVDGGVLMNYTNSNVYSFTSNAVHLWEGSNAVGLCGDKRIYEPLVQNILNIRNNVEIESSLKVNNVYCSNLVLNGTAVSTASPSNMTGKTITCSNLYTDTKAVLGYVGWADWAGFAHSNKANANDYALIQYSGGDTILNCGGGTGIGFRCGNLMTACMNQYGHFSVKSRLTFCSSNLDATSYGWTISRDFNSNIGFYFVSSQQDGIDGTSLTGSKFTVENNGNCSVASNLLVNNRLDVGGSGSEKLYVNGNVKFDLGGSIGSYCFQGDRNFVIYNGSGSALWSSGTGTSDKAKKKDIRPIDGALDKVCALNGVYFNYLPELNIDDKHQIGLLAEDVKAIIPEAVRELPDLGGDGKTSHLVAYEKLTALLIEAVKELKKEIDELKSNKK